MKKIIIIFSLSLALFFSAFTFAQADGGAGNACTKDQQSTSLCNPVRSYQGNIASIAFRAIEVAATFFNLLAVIMVVYSGFRMIISQGNEEDLVTAKSSLQWALSGLALAMFAFVIIYATGSFIGARNLNTQSYVGNNDVVNPLDTNIFGDKVDSFGAFLFTILKGFLSLVGILTILMIVVGGFRYVTAAGNEEQSASGKKTIQWAVIGLIVALFAYVLINATLTFFKG